MGREREREILDSAIRVSVICAVCSLPFSYPLSILHHVYTSIDTDPYEITIYI